MKVNNIYQHKQLKERQDTSLVLNNSEPAKFDVSQKSHSLLTKVGEESDQSNSKLSVACQSENTSPDSTRTNVVNKLSKHSVFVLGVNGKALTPCAKSKARKLLKGGVACKVWSKFNTFGIQMKEKTREEKPEHRTIGGDPGGKYDGMSVVIGDENVINVKLNLPDKKSIKRKMEERSILRRNRRSRLRRREEKYNNRSKKGFIAPSQFVIVNSRLSIFKECVRIYPVNKTGLENVAFNHAKHRWGKYFSTAELGKSLLRKFFADHNIGLKEFQGHETKEFREKYGYKKTSSKSVDKFESHCSDSLTLALKVGIDKWIEPGPFIVVDDTYRCIRRKLHDLQFKKGGIKEKYSCGTIKGIQKGKIIGVKNGKIGQLCGAVKEKIRYFDIIDGDRHQTTGIIWISNAFRIRRKINEM